MQNRILLILPYFGTFPNYFDLWLEGVKNNPDIDFLLLTDNHTAYHYPSNLRVEYLTFNELVVIIQEHFDFRIALETPYKLCDFRPAYGFIFSGYLDGYDFWGYCDCDLVFGNIRKFVTDSVLNSFDRIFEFGHLCLYRNTKDVNFMFLKQTPGVRYYKNVFSSKISQCFDEICGMTPIWNSLRPNRVFRERPFDDIDYTKFRFNVVGTNSNKSYVYSYKDGVLSRSFLDGDTVSYKEVCYVHFQKRKLSKADCLNFSDYFIIPNKFVAPMELSPAIFRTLSREHIYLYPLRIKLKSVLRKVKFRYENLLCHGTLK